MITRKHDICNVGNVYIMPSAECDTDHSWMRGRFELSVTKKNQMPGVIVPECLDVNKLKQKDVCSNLTERLDCSDLDDTWENFKDHVYFTCLDGLGYKVRKHKDWFNDNETAIRQLLKKARFI